MAGIIIAWVVAFNITDDVLGRIIVFALYSIILPPGFNSYLRWLFPRNELEFSKQVTILQGEKDIQTTIDQALLLEQKLTELKHPDHTLITYPKLGHTFYPAKGPNELLGSIQDYVLADLHAWLKERFR